MSHAAGKVTLNTTGIMFTTNLITLLKYKYYETHIAIIHYQYQI